MATIVNMDSAKTELSDLVARAYADEAIELDVPVITACPVVQDLGAKIRACRKLFSAGDK